jgi:acid stress-induced BolA-like protein IbaG/YrbA
MTPEQITLEIETALPGARARVVSEDGVHFAAVVVAPQFEGLRPLARHQLVYRALGAAVGGVIHALSLDTVTPAEWAGRGMD